MSKIDIYSSDDTAYQLGYQRGKSERIEVVFHFFEIWICIALVFFLELAVCIGFQYRFCFAGGFRHSIKPDIVFQ